MVARWRGAVIVAMVVEVVRAGGHHCHIGGGRRAIVGHPSGCGREWVIQVDVVAVPLTLVVGRPGGSSGCLVNKSSSRWCASSMPVIG